MERLNVVLTHLGISQATPTHVTYNVLSAIYQLALFNDDSDLETACESMMRSIQQANKG